MLYQSGLIMSSGSVVTAVIDRLIVIIDRQVVSVGYGFVVIGFSDAFEQSLVGYRLGIEVGGFKGIVSDIPAPMVVCALGAPVFISTDAVIDEFKFKFTSDKVFALVDDDASFVGNSHVVGWWVKSGLTLLGIEPRFSA